jgi:hypothetical protein
MNLREKYQTDPEKERNGIRVEIEESVFFVRRMGGNNHAWRYALASAMDKHRPEIVNGNGAEVLAVFDATERSLQDAFVATCFIGWENVPDAEHPIEFTREAAMALLLECPDVWLQLRNTAQSIDSFRKEDVHALGES